MEINPNNAWPTAFPVIDDGDICGNVEHLATAQALADAATYLRGGIEGKASSFTASYAAASLPPFVNEAGWALVPEGMWRWGGPTVGNKLALPLPRLPIGAKLSAVRIRVGQRSGSGLPSSLPVTKPTLKLFKLEFDAPPSHPGSAATQLGGTATDPSSTLDEYKQPHAIAVSLGAPETITAGVVYYIEIAGSSGDNVDNSDELAVATIETDIVP